MHYSHADILELAQCIGEGWKRTTLTLEEGDTAHSGLSTKWDFAGPGEVTYLIHPSGWHITPGEGITQHFI